jgi:hypothetical protein
MISRHHFNTYGAAGPYLGAMIGTRGRSATVKAIPRAHPMSMPGSMDRTGRRSK